jgi:hypothetical protein
MMLHCGANEGSLCTSCLYGLTISLLRHVVRNVVHDIVSVAWRRAFSVPLCRVAFDRDFKGYFGTLYHSHGPLTPG